MKHHNNSPLWISVPHWVHSFCALCALALFGLTHTEAHAAEIFPDSRGNGAVLSDPRTSLRHTDTPLFEETEKHARTVADPYRQARAEIRTVSFWTDIDSARFTFTLFLQDRSHDGPAPLDTGGADPESKTPVVPISAPPSAGLLFMTALVGMLGTVARGESRLKRTLRRVECHPQLPDSSRSVVVLSSDASIARDLHTHLRGAGYEVRMAATVREIFAFTDPASLLLILVDRRIQDWDMLRTDPSLRHVLLMAVVPTDCLYTDGHYVSDLERGIDGVHDLRDGYRLLVAKVGAYLRRAGRHDMRRGVYQVGAIELDRDAHEVKIAGRQVKLSAKPFAILTVLMREPSKIFSRSTLVDLVWGTDFAVCEHTVDVHVHVLRQQLDREPNRLCELVTINRVGFTLRPVSSATSIRTRRLRSTSRSISTSRTCSIQLPSLLSKRLTPPSRRLLLGPPFKPPVNKCIAPACG